MAALSTDSSADEDSDVSDGDSYADADAKAYSTTDIKRQKRDYSSFSGFLNSFSSFPEPTFSPFFNYFCGRNTFFEQENILI